MSYIFGKAKTREKIVRPTYHTVLKRKCLSMFWKKLSLGLMYHFSALAHKLVERRGYTVEDIDFLPKFVGLKALGVLMGSWFNSLEPL